MTLYTIQEEFKWLEFQKTGILKADENIICEESFFDSYTWIESKMHQLLPPSKIETIHPIWAWYKYNGKNKPDLRRNCHIGKGKVGYRIEFEIDDDKVLLTDFSDWHLVLNADDYDRKVESCCIELNWFDDDPEGLEDCLKKGFIKEDKIIYPWNNIILQKDSKIKDIQATMWYIDISQVKNVDKFKSR